MPSHPYKLDINQQDELVQCHMANNNKTLSECMVDQGIRVDKVGPMCCVEFSNGKEVQQLCSENTVKPTAMSTDIWKGGDKRITRASVESIGGAICSVGLWDKLGKANKGGYSENKTPKMYFQSAPSPANATYAFASPAKHVSDDGFAYLHADNLDKIDSYTITVQSDKSDE